MRNSNRIFTIKERREQLGLRQIDVAMQCGVGLTTVQKWDKGEFNALRARNAKALAKCLKLKDDEMPKIWKYEER